MRFHTHATGTDIPPPGLLRPPLPRTGGSSLAERGEAAFCLKCCAGVPAQVGGWGQDPPCPRTCPTPRGSGGWRPRPPTHQHVYALHGRGVHPPGFKRPVCPKMALQSCLLGKTGAERLQQPFCAVLHLSQPTQQAPRLTLFLPSVPELRSSRTGDQNPTL